MYMSYNRYSLNGKESIEINFLQYDIDIFTRFCSKNTISSPHTYERYRDTDSITYTNTHCMLKYLHSS